MSPCRQAVTVWGALLPSRHSATPSYNRGFLTNYSSLRRRLTNEQLCNDRPVIACDELSRMLIRKKIKMTPQSDGISKRFPKGREMGRI